MVKQIKAIHLIKEKNITELNPNIFDAIENIDEENHVIKNVCLFGTRFSANKRVYQDKAISKLSELSEGNKVFIDHPSNDELKQRDGVRSLRDWAGIFKNITRKEDKVYGDLQCREAYFDLVKDIAKLQPKNIGCSINARVKAVQSDDGMESIVDIDSLKSVDLVAAAATTSSLFEAKLEENLNNNAGGDNTSMEKLTLDELKTDHKDLIDLIVKEYEEKQNTVVIKDELETVKKENETIKTELVTVKNEVTIKEAEIVKVKADVEQKDKEVQYVVEAFKELEKERDTLKVKIDEVEVKQKIEDKKTYIRAMIEQAKLPNEANTEVWFGSLMKEEDVKVVEALINDRKNLFVSDGKVKNSGQSFDVEDLLKPKVQTTFESKEELDKELDNFIMKIKR